MNQRERFLKTMTFGSPDRPTYGDYLVYPSTQERWESEGLPKNLSQAELFSYFGMDRIDIWVNGTLLLNNGPMPAYEEQLIEETADYTIARNSRGHVTKTLRNARSPAMPQFLEHPVKDRKSWDEFKKRLDPNLEERYPHVTGNYVKNTIESIAAGSCDRDFPFGVWLGGTYGFIRDFMGVENASYVFYDDIGLVDDMVEHLTYFYLTLFRGMMSRGVQFDWVMFWEDMAYNHGSLLSPGMYVKHCMPFYFKVIEEVKKSGIKVIMMDCDGRIDDLIPIWADAGINVMHPMEVAAGMDVRKVRKEYGNRMAFLGGIDKR